MITLFKTDKIHSLSQIKEEVLKHILQLPNQFSMIGELSAILRFEFNIEPIDILTWMNNQQSKNKIYWSDRQKNFEVGGIHFADKINIESANSYKEVFDEISQKLFTNNPRLRYYGGFQFNPSEPAQWQNFGRLFFIVPQFEIYRDQDNYLFAFNIRMDEINQEKIKAYAELASKIDFSLTTTYRRPAPKVVNRLDAPDKAQWEKTVTQALKLIKDKELEKVVLARKSVFDFDRTINPIALIKHLSEMTPNCFHFCFTTDQHNAFLGASPERLFKYSPYKVETEAMAGTMKRGESGDIDAQISQNLLSSPKHLKEHQYVIDEINSGLIKHCEQIKSEHSPSTVKLNEGQHLLTKFVGSLKKDVEAFDILETLHPTPAVGGFPRQKALEAIKSLELSSRGFYAGPIGYIEANGCEFAVAIRSGLIQEHQLSLFAGAGIINGSTPEEEWDEIEHKISSWIKVFNL